MGVRFRRDVEKILRADKFPFGQEHAIYDTDTGMGVAGRRVGVDLSWSHTNDLRAKIVQFIVDGAMNHPEQKVEPFTVPNAHEAMGNRDLLLDSVLVNTDFVPLLANVIRPWLGVHYLKVFAHDEVPPGDIYGFAEPDYVGIVARNPMGGVGVLVTNMSGIIWGRFRLRRDR
jgi:hypothetical protein